MAHSEAQSSSEQNAEALVVRVEGDLELATVMVVRQDLERAFATSAKRVVVDLRAVGFLDSSGIQALVEAHQRFETSGRTFALLVAPGPVHRTLEVCGVLGLLDHATGKTAAA